MDISDEMNEMLNKLLAECDARTKTAVKISQAQSSLNNFLPEERKHTEAISDLNQKLMDLFLKARYDAKHGYSPQKAQLYKCVTDIYDIEGDMVVSGTTDTLMGFLATFAYQVAAIPGLYQKNDDQGGWYDEKSNVLAFEPVTE